MEKKVTELFREVTGKEPVTVTPIRGGGSNRRYCRISAEGGLSLIGVEGTSIPEDRAFCGLSSHFRAKGLNVPEVLAHTPDYSAYLQEDLGSDSLFDLLGTEGSEGLLLKTMAYLPKIQFEGAPGLDWSLCFPQEAFDARMISFDLNYFKYCFLKPSGLEFDEIALQNDFDRLSATLMGNMSDAFMYRDFQARNVIIRDGEPWFIDFQGGRRGPVQYDVASFVWQARAAYSDDLKKRLVDAYIDAAGKYMEMDRERFLSSLRHFVLFRTLQVLGAYGFRGLTEKKEHFIRSIPFAIENLRKMFDEGLPGYPCLAELSARLSEKFPPEEKKGDGSLEVKVCSFSYKKGIPADESGNGGGYVFDCRAIENPGRYEQYRSLTGRDGEVIRFLEEKSTIAGFLSNVWAMTDPHIEKFIERGFTHLEICFGCTGGQHRSVYSAERTARHIREKYNVKVTLVHTVIDS